MAVVFQSIGLAAEQLLRDDFAQAHRDPLVAVRFVQRERHSPLESRGSLQYSRSEAGSFQHSPVQRLQEALLPPPSPISVALVVLGLGAWIPGLVELFLRDYQQFSGRLVRSHPLPPTPPR